MSAETRKVLDMLAEGKVTSADAERLLDKLALGKSPDEGSNGSGAGAKDSRPLASKFRFLRVKVDTGEGHDVNVKVPLGFIRAGVKLLGVLPPRVAQKLNDKGVNLDFLSDLKGDELDEALNELHVDLETDEGQHVQVFCE
ncbi:MAG: hypothetical protein ABSD98_17210 [Candidatus Korobacteraceae bacterium]